VIPKVLGDAVGLTPLTLLFSVAAVTLLFGGFAVILAIPFVAVLATIIDVIVFNKEPGRGGRADGALPGGRGRELGAPPTGDVATARGESPRMS
jgi:hypothetical protein